MELLPKRRCFEPDRAGSGKQVNRVRLMLWAGLALAGHSWVSNSKSDHASTTATVGQYGANSFKRARGPA